MPAEADAAPVKLMASRIIARNISSFSPPCLYVARRRRLTSTIVYSRLAASTSDGERLVATKQAYKKAGGDRHPRGAHSFQVQRVWRIRHPRAKRERTSVGKGKSVSVRVDPGGIVSITKKKKNK